MTKKDLYKLSVKISGQVLRDYFGASETNFKDMEANAGRKLARKNAYEALAPLLLDKEPAKE